MFETAKQFLFEITENLRVADFIDIMLVAAFLYTIINILRKSVSRKLLITIAIFIGIYIIARLLGMYLTEMFIRILIIFISLAARVQKIWC
jgi:DNA integrity scanning protein DisA with diadenylate cyclase activity